MKLKYYFLLIIIFFAIIGVFFFGYNRNQLKELMEPTSEEKNHSKEWFMGSLNLETQKGCKWTNPELEGKWENFNDLNDNKITLLYLSKFDIYSGENKSSYHFTIDDYKKMSFFFSDRSHYVKKGNDVFYFLYTTRNRVGVYFLEGVADTLKPLKRSFYSISGFAYSHKTIGNSLCCSKSHWFTGGLIEKDLKFRQCDGSNNILYGKTKDKIITEYFSIEGLNAFRFISHYDNPPNELLTNVKEGRQYAINDKNIFWGPCLISGLDSSVVKIDTDGLYTNSNKYHDLFEDNWQGYFITKNKVYNLKSQILFYSGLCYISGVSLVNGADPTTFSVIQGLYWKDGNSIFYGNQKLFGSNSNESYSILDQNLGGLLLKTNEYVYSGSKIFDLSKHNVFGIYGKERFLTTSEDKIINTTNGIYIITGDISDLLENVEVFYQDPLYIYTEKISYPIMIGTGSFMLSGNKRELYLSEEKGTLVKGQNKYVLFFHKKDNSVDTLSYVVNFDKKENFVNDGMLVKKTDKLFIDLDYNNVGYKGMCKTNAVKHIKKNYYDQYILGDIEKSYTGKFIVELNEGYNLILGDVNQEEDYRQIYLQKPNGQYTMTIDYIYPEFCHVGCEMGECDASEDSVYSYTIIQYTGGIFLIGGNIYNSKLDKLYKLRNTVYYEYEKKISQDAFYFAHKFDGKFHILEPELDGMYDVLKKPLKRLYLSKDDLSLVKKESFCWDDKYKNISNIKGLNPKTVEIENIDGTEKPYRFSVSYGCYGTYLNTYPANCNGYTSGSDLCKYSDTSRYKILNPKVFEKNNSEDTFIENSILKAIFYDNNTVNILNIQYK